MRPLPAYINKTLSQANKSICTFFISVTESIYIIQLEVLLGP